MSRSVHEGLIVLTLALFALAGCDEKGAVDGGPLRDAGALRDAAAEQDAGRDAGRAIDAGDAAMAGEDGGSEDAGASDAGAEGDAGVEGDAGAEGDAGVEGDAGTEGDAGVEGDAGALGPEPRPGDLVIVEIQGNPQTATDEQAEYIELLNVSGRTLNLQGCRLTHRSAGPFVSHLIDESVVVAPGARVLLARSSGGYFGGATRDYVYGGFVFANGATQANTLRVMAPGWDGTEASSAAFVVDEVTAPAGNFDNDLRGRAWQLDPDRVPAPTAAGNDDPDDWCHAAESAALAYWSSNWGTPRAENRCD